MPIGKGGTEATDRLVNDVSTLKGTPMKTSLNWKLMMVALTVLVAVGVEMIPWTEMGRLSSVVAAIGLQSTWAASTAGIAGQPAPELGLDTWIDGNGNAMPPVRLADYRGTVVLPYFFQDW
jgi:hypothetical protein